eukprot:403377414
MRLLGLGAIALLLLSSSNYVRGDLSNSIKRFIGEPLYYLNEIGFCFAQVVPIDFSVYGTHFFKQYGISYEDLQGVLEGMHEWMDRPNEMLSESNIPAYSHRVWITDPIAPREITDYQKEPEVYQNMLTTNRVLESDGTKWTHYLWVNDKSLVPESVKWFESNGFIIREITELKEDRELMRIIDHHISQGKAIDSSDVLRNQILYEVGGLYIDLDVWIDEWSSIPMKIADLIFVQEYIDYFDSFFFNNDLILAKPGHPVLKEANRVFKSQFIQPNLEPNTTLNMYTPCFKNLSQVLPFKVGIYMHMIALVNKWEEVKDRTIMLRIKNPQQAGDSERQQKLRNPNYDIEIQDGSRKQFTVVARSMIQIFWFDLYSDLLTFGWTGTQGLE